MTEWLGSSRGVFVAVAGGSLATVMAATTVPIALPQIADEMDSPLPAVQWVATGYLLAFCVGIPLSAWAVRRLGAGRAWLSAMTVFCVGSFASGLARSLELLVACRVLAGVGAALVLPIGQVILAAGAGPAHVARALSMLAIVNLLGPTFGPVVGGGALDALGWRAVLICVAPLAAAAIALGWRAMEPGHADPTARLDAVGLVILGGGLAAVTYACARIGRVGGVDAVAAACAVCGLLLVGAAWRWMRARGPRALLDVAALRSPAAGRSATIVLAFGASMFGGLLVLPLYWEHRGAGSVGAGLLTVPQGAGSFLVLVVTARLTRRFATRSLALAGLTIATAATAAFVVGVDASEGMLSASLFFRGIGLSLVLTPVLAGAFATAAPAALPALSVLFNVALRLGASIGTAVLAAVLGHRMGAHGGFTAAFALLSLISLLSLIPAAGLGVLSRQRSRAPARDLEGGAGEHT
jgi:MFS family permease